MKKLFLTAIAIFSVAFATFANNGNVALLSNNGASSSFEQAGPHTKQYLDIKEILDKYDQAVKKASSCEELDEADSDFYLSLIALAFSAEYDESDEMTPEEDEELTDLLERITEMREDKAERYDCPTEDEDEDESYLTPTTTEEWDEMIDEYEVLLSKLENLSKQNLSTEQNMEKVMEIIQDHYDLIDRIDNADTENLTDRQENRLIEINERIEYLLTKMGVLDEED